MEKIFSQKSLNYYYQVQKKYKNVWYMEKRQSGEKELIVTCRAIPNYDKIKELYGDLSDKEVHKIIWDKIKQVNKKVTNYKAIKSLELKDGEFIKTTTKKIKRFIEIKEGKIKNI